MGFASAYLEEKALFPQFITDPPEKNTGIIVVIPAYDEPGVCKVLDSLSKCIKPHCSTEVIIVVNAPGNASEESLVNNLLTVKNVEKWESDSKDHFFRLFVVNAGSVYPGSWGVGMARKTGMDEAVRRFNSIGRPDGVILNLDADCTVNENYFEAVCNYLYKDKSKKGCSVYFEHPLSGDEFTENIYTFITLYELHLRYYLQGLVYTGFPYSFHTVGSSTAVKALPYVQAGGMNRRQAGEDFYFIQKLVPAGGYFALNKTTVHPSPRPSFRVPFGTGASVEKLSASENNILLTYNPEAFCQLRLFFDAVPEFYSCGSVDFSVFYESLPELVRSFVGSEEMEQKLSEISDNTNGVHSFRKRFFNWFNMFKIVKYLNFIHNGLLRKMDVVEAARLMLEMKETSPHLSAPVQLLLYYRKMELES